MADRSATHRCFRAPGSQRAPAALPRRVTAADIMCSVVPAGAELRHVEFFGGSTAGAPTLASCAPQTQYSPRARPTSEHTTTSLPLTPPTMHSPSTLAGKAHGTPNLGWKCRRHGLVAPSAAGQRHAAQTCATNLRPLSLVFTPDFALSRLTRYRERRAAPSLLHFRQVHPARTPIFGRQEAQDGARDRPGVDSPRRCGVSARPWRVQGCA